MGNRSVTGALGHRYSYRSSVRITLGILLVATGCAAEPTVVDDDTGTHTTASTPEATSTTESTTPVDTQPEASSGSATFVVDGRTFTADLAFCMTADGEVLLHGPGAEVGTDVTGYFDGDVTVYEGAPNGEFRFDVGATGQFESSDEFIAMGSAFGDLEMTPADDGWTATGPAWSDDGTALGEGIVEFQC